MHQKMFSNGYNISFPLLEFSYLVIGISATLVLSLSVRVGASGDLHSSQALVKGRPNAMHGGSANPLQSNVLHCLHAIAWAVPYYYSLLNGLFIYYSSATVNAGRTVAGTPTIYTSKRPARSCEVCYYFYWRLELPWRRN